MPTLEEYKSILEGIHKDDGTVNAAGLGDLMSGLTADLARLTDLEDRAAKLQATVTEQNAALARAFINHGTPTVPGSIEEPEPVNYEEFCGGMKL